MSKMPFLAALVAVLMTSPIGGGTAHASELLIMVTPRIVAPTTNTQRPIQDLNHVKDSVGQ